MRSDTMASTAAGEVVPLFHAGRMFVGPVFDYLIIGGGLSLVLGVLLWWHGVPGLGAGALTLLFVVSNNAHFAASTLRLYTRPGAVVTLPLLTLALPVIAVVITSVAIAAPEPAGLLLFALYLVWSPYHYSAQAYGLAVMYAYRSGADLDDACKRVVRWACLAPFLWTLLQPQGGVAMVLGHMRLVPVPALEPLRSATGALLAVVTILAPVLAFAWLRARTGVTLPVISVVIVGSNAVWWTLFNYLDAFVWATVFHGLQYLAIVTIFHVKDCMRRPGNRHGPAVHALGFYGACVALGYVLFHLWPWGYRLTGLDLVKSALLVGAAVNIHHFIVDAYIWRLRKDPNYRNVVDEPAAAPA